MCTGAGYWYGKAGSTLTGSRARRVTGFREQIWFSVVDLESEIGAKLKEADSYQVPTKSRPICAHCYRGGGLTSWSACR